MTVKIESNSNSIYKHIKKLQTRSGRSKASQYLAEGLRSVRDAVENGADVEYVIICEGTDNPIEDCGIRVYEMSRKLYDTLKSTVNSQGIIAVINYDLPSANCINPDNCRTIVYLDCVSDPGNMGTIIRSCDALGADAIILSKGCVDIYNPKVVRSTMASINNVNIYTDESPQHTFDTLKACGFDIIGTFPDAETPCHKIDYNSKTVLVMGNEANGISEEVESCCTKHVTIPMMGRAESLNVATALTVMLYEIMRSRI